MKDEQRFERVLKQSTSLGAFLEVFVDLETGVQYLYHSNGYGGGMTVLLGTDGKPLLYRE